MKKLNLNDIKINNDFLRINIENINLCFSTAEKNRSFNRNIDLGVENLKSIVEEFRLSDIQYLKQVHSDTVYTYNEYDLKEKEGDALITNVKDVAIGVFTADCVPIIIVDNKNKVIGAIHSGWKGTFKSIVLKTLDKMKEEFNIDISSTKVFIGPHIRQCCYEVSEDLKNDFLNKTKIEEKKLFKKRNLSLEECILKDVRDFGILEENIYSIDLCTHCEEKLKLYSYRKSVGTYGRLFSFAFIK